MPLSVTVSDLNHAPLLRHLRFTLVRNSLERALRGYLAKAGLQKRRASQFMATVQGKLFQFFLNIHTVKFTTFWYASVQGSEQPFLGRFGRVILFP